MKDFRFTLRDFYDSSSELVGIKSGILLNRFHISEILREVYTHSFLHSDLLDTDFPLSSQYLKNAVIYLRRRLGNLPPESITKKDQAVYNEYVRRNISVAAILGAARAFLAKNPNKTKQELFYELVQHTSINQELAEAITNITFEEEDFSLLPKNAIEWNKPTSLSEIFEKEIKPQDNSDFIDQKFLDYLAVNGHEIENIHWRNFERFCAEYFKREGFYVLLGAGSHDGGIDIRAFKDTKQPTPLIMIQCKRYKENRKVTIESVKAFHPDLVSENAPEGLIATTGYISDGGKKVCNTRKYNISFAEKERIKKWAINMWRYKI